MNFVSPVQVCLTVAPFFVGFTSHFSFLLINYLFLFPLQKNHITNNACNDLDCLELFSWLTFPILYIYLIHNLLSSLCTRPFHKLPTRLSANITFTVAVWCSGRISHCFHCTTEMCSVYTESWTGSSWQPVNKPCSWSRVIGCQLWGETIVSKRTEADRKYFLTSVTHEHDHKTVLNVFGFDFL